MDVEARKSIRLSSISRKERFWNRLEGEEARGHKKQLRGRQNNRKMRWMTEKHVFRQKREKRVFMKKKTNRRDHVGGYCTHDRSGQNPTVKFEKGLRRITLRDDFL